MKNLTKHPIFWGGLLIRLVLLGFAQPFPVTEWYVPFMASTVHFSLDPWALWLNNGGTSVAFPYGYVMWLSFLPSTLISQFFGLSSVVCYGLTLLFADLALLFLLKKINPPGEKRLLCAYWLSPIVLVASYVQGFNDLIPVLLMVTSLYFVRQTRPFVAGLFTVAAISAKLSMALALPFYIIYFWHNSSQTRFIYKFLKGIALGLFIFFVPFLFTHAGLGMLLNNKEMTKVYQLSLNMGGSTSIYVVPLLYLINLYVTWRVKRINFELFNTTLGIGFLVVVLMSQASPGWFIWALPLLVSYQMRCDRVGIALVSVFSLLYVITDLLLSPSAWAAFGADTSVILAHAYQQLGQYTTPLLYTTMVATGLVLILRIWRETISRNDFFRLSRKPFVIGIAGDSGAGKDTFSDALKGLFGQHTVTTLSGDDYHLWDRQKPMWQVLTHLNPMANDLERFTSDLVELTDGKSIHARHYDHQTGRMTRPFKIKSNDIIIASGLHALYLPLLRECYNLSVYLNIDENLRRHFKMERDVKKRGHSVEKVLAAFERREADSESFIRPQAKHADLVLSLQPIHPGILKNIEKHPLRFKLVALSRHGLNEMALTRVLIGVCGLHVDMELSSDTSEVELTIEGETTAEDIALAAKLVCPRIIEFLDIEPEWHDGVMGLMQLITLSHINQALTRRIIC